MNNKITNIKKVNLTIALKHRPKVTASLFDKIVAKAIQWRTKSIYYHSELIIGNRWISSDITNGVQVHKLKTTLNHDEWVYLPLGEHTVTEEQCKLITTFITQITNSKYDILGIFLSQTIKIGVNNKNKWFCSEVVSKILQLFLVKEYIDIVPHDISPADLFKLYNKITGVSDGSL